MWNSLNLKCPSEDVCKYGAKDGLLLKELPNLVSLLTSSAEVLTQDHPIWTEIKVFQNVQAKYRRTLHCDKCLLLLQRVGSCLRKMVLLNLSKTYLDLAELFLVGLQSQKTSIILPSRQQLEYALLRTQSAAKLICEALYYSKETFCYLIQRLKVGHLILSLMMATSVTARVNILFKGILIQIFDLYRKLYSWNKRLKSGTSEWPQPLDLPEDLEIWLKLDVSELLKPKLVSKDQIKFLANLFEKVKDKEKKNNESDEVEKVDEGKTMDEDCVIIEDTRRLSLSNDLDIGEAVPRSEEEIEDNPLSESQQILLRKIETAKTIKKLSIIWDNIDQVQLPNVLMPSKIREVDKIILQAKSKIRYVKSLNFDTEKRKERFSKIVALTRKKLARNLGLLGTKSKSLDTSSDTLNQSIEELKPAETYKEMKQLYENLLQGLQATQQYKKCAKLKKVFKSRRADIKLLFKKGEIDIAKSLIFCTSKVFLTRYKL